MCGRFVQKTPLPELAVRFGAELHMEDPGPRYNVAPATPAAVLRAEPGGRRVLAALRWGWTSPGRSFLFLARAETAAERPSFREALCKRRCLVPVDGFFEWMRRARPRRPYYFSRRDGEPLALAGLWERGGRSEKGFPAFVLLTRAADAVLAPVHDRMPVILEEKDIEAWLDPALRDPVALEGFWRPYPAERLEGHPVSLYVNSTRNEGPQCIEPAPPPEGGESVENPGFEF